MNKGPTVSRLRGRARDLQIRVRFAEQILLVQMLTSNGEEDVLLVLRLYFFGDDDQEALVLVFVVDALYGSVTGSTDDLSQCACNTSVSRCKGVE